ncbi:MAG TPA: pyridoxamine 5'-phosphate oxidase family protein [Candidatus Kryptonia bacterium]|nr:pyridoxamine 5'-phosphate oxidase family protein [Candidatus Kryptonia bacterium]
MQDEVEAYLKEHRSMVLSYACDGEVHAATSCYALADHLVVYFFVFRDSEKHRAIRARPQVSVVVDDGFTIPMHGIELLGRASVVSGDEARTGQQLLSRRFPQLAEAWNDDRVLIAKVEPERIRVIDWTQGFGHSRHGTVSKPVS